MVLTANILNIYPEPDAKSLDDIHVEYAISNLNPESGFIHSHKDELRLPTFIETCKENSYRAGNFFMKQNGMPSMLDEAFAIGTGPLTEEPASTEKTITLSSIIAELAHLNASFLFKEEYYKTTTSGVSFDSFRPDFNEVEFHARNLIISRKKFNIVLAASIRGSIYAEGILLESYRYYPFKLVRAGKPQFPYLYVIVSKLNEEYLQHIGATEIETGIAVIDLHKYPVFETKMIDPSINNLLFINRDIKRYRLILKGFRHYLGKLRTEMKTRGIRYDSRDWFSGEGVDDDYMGDDGDQLVEVWEKGKKEVQSVTSLLNELGEFGDGFKQIIEGTVSISYVDTNDIMVALENISKVLKKAIEDKTIDSDEYIVLASLLSVLSTGGEYMERYLDVKQKIKQQALQLNYLELKLQTLRWNILTGEKPIERLGSLMSRTKDRRTLQSPQGTAIIKQGVIVKEESPVTAVISENIGE